jgi:TPR repeat protein
LEPLAQAGDVEAMDMLGVVSADAGDVETAVHWFTLVAKEGFDYGASYAGTKVLGPSGVDCTSAHDRQIARRYLTISAEVGNTLDQGVLALLCIMDKDYDCAQKWWTRIIAEASPEHPAIVAEARGNLEHMSQDPGYVAHRMARRLGDRS